MSHLVLYHGNCYDGVTAAWVVYKALDLAFEGGVSNLEYLPMNYSDPCPDVKGKDVIIIVFSFKRPIMEKIIEDCSSLIVLDHHKTVEAELKDLANPKGNIVFDMNRSG